MSIETGIVAKLLAGTLTSALVGARVYPNRAPQGTSADCVVYQQITGQRSYTNDGACGLVSAMFRLTCWSTTLLGARNLANAVRIDLEAATPGTWDGTVIQSCFVDTEVDIDSGFVEDAILRYGKALDLDIAFTETP